VRINEEKMSKSLGNFFTIRDILQQHRSEAVRYFLLSSHYRSPLNYTDEQLRQAKITLTSLYMALHGLPQAARDAHDPFVERFYAAMDDDFNTPEAMAVLADLKGEIFKSRAHDMERAARLGASLRELGAILGILQQDSEGFLKGVDENVAVLHVELPALELHATGTVRTVDELVEQRTAARRARNWAQADRIRKELADQGVILEDLPDGSTLWRRA
jgi:cysteinyl-tRNA synthetase